MNIAKKELISGIRRNWHIQRSVNNGRRHRSGQALVEMAISVTVLALLLAAAIDLGLAYKTYQTLVNATAEASSYLDLNPTVNCAVEPCPNLADERMRAIAGAHLETANVGQGDQDVFRDRLIREWGF